MNNTSSSQARPGTSGEARTIRYWRWGGYGLLALALFDLVESLIPPGFMNARWELEFMGMTIERSPVLLLGFLFVLHAEWLQRGRWERMLVRAVSWFSLVAGLGFLLMIPLLVLNSFRVESSGEKQLNAQLDQQFSQAKALQEVLATAQGESLETLLVRAGRSVEGVDLEVQRQEMLAELSGAQQELQRRAEDARTSQKLELNMRTYKHVVQAFVVGWILVALWFGSGWARKGSRKK